MGTPSDSISREENTYLVSATEVLYFPFYAGEPKTDTPSQIHVPYPKEKQALLAGGQGWVKPLATFFPSQEMQTRVMHKQALGLFLLYVADEKLSPNIVV